MRFRLSTLLVAINVGLLLLAVSGVAFVAARLLEQLADEQARARATQAATNAQQSVARLETELQTTARLLAERPTLLRLAGEADTQALNLFLDQFRSTSQLDGAAVVRAGRLLASGGQPFDWPALAAPNTQPSIVQASPDGGLVLAASTLTPAGDTVVVARALDAEFESQLGSQISLAARIVAAPPAAASTPEDRLRAQVLAGGPPDAVRTADTSSYLAVAPLPGAGVPALIEVTLPATGVTSSVERLIQTLALLALGVAAVAALLSLLVGRQLGSPLRALTAAAARIGAGDLDTPIPQARGAEIGTLARTLEEMRHKLRRLTTDLRRQEAEANAIIEGVVEGVFTVDRNRVIRFVNPQAAALLGVPVDDAIGRFCGDVLNPRPHGGVRPCVERCPIVHARRGGSARATEHLELSDGRLRTVVITSAASAEGHQVQVLRDETELEATRRMRDVVFANMSHEFRTPLSAQLASIELLLHQLPDLTTDQIGQLVLSLHRGTLRLTQLIDNLLESVRIEVGQNSIRRQPVALDEVIEEALELTRPLLGQRRQEVALNLPYPLPMVQGDAQRLTQVFVNLLANANKFAPADSSIQVGGAISAGSVQLWVEDEGPGLPPSADESLFDRFVRGADGEPEQSGMGLGLAIVKSIVERHGGQVSAISAGAGTRMLVTLPSEIRDV